MNTVKLRLLYLSPLAVALHFDTHDMSEYRNYTRYGHILNFYPTQLTDESSDFMVCNTNTAIKITVKCSKQKVDILNGFLNGFGKTTSPIPSMSGSAVFTYSL